MPIISVDEALFFFETILSAVKKMKVNFPPRSLKKCVPDFIHMKRNCVGAKPIVHISIDMGQSIQEWTK